jgi:hypothetical protein
MAYNRTLQHFTSSQELATQWASGQSYILDQLVLNNDKLYRCILAHTSGASFAGDSIYWSGINPGQTIAIADGGTGQTTQTAAFDALAPTTTAGDIIVHNGTDNVRQGIGSDGQVLVADNTQPNKLKWATLQQGAKNYITYGTFENGATTGWSLFNTTLTSKIPTGSITAGAASITSFAVDSTTPIAGTYDLRVASSGALTAGQGFISDAFTIDREDQAKPLAFSFAYEAVSGTMDFSGTSNNTFAVYIYDVSGSAWIQPAGVYNLVQSSGVGIASGTFQTTATGTQYRIAVVCITATAGAVEMRFDTFQLGPQGTVQGAAISDFGSTPWTPVSTWNAGTTVTGTWRRVGDELEGYVKVLITNAGLVPATNLFVSLPSGYTIDTSKLLLGGAGYATTTGRAELYNASGGAAHTAQVFYNSASQVGVFYTTATNGAQGNVTPSAPFSFINNSAVHIYFSVPIVGWSSNTVLSQDTDTRVVAARVKTSSARTLNNTSPIIVYESVDFDSHGAYNSTTGVYTVPVSGFYRVTGNLYVNAVATSVGFLTALRLFKGASGIANLGGIRAETTASAQKQGNGSTVFNFNAGDEITIRGYADTANTLVASQPEQNYVSIERLSGPATIAASETVAARYTSSGGPLISDNTYTRIDFANKVFDTTSSVTTGASWAFTAPISGKYQVNSKVTVNYVNDTSYTAIKIQKNLSDYSVSQRFWQASGAGAVFPSVAVISDIVECVAGDTITIWFLQNTAGARNLTTTATENTVSIVRVGN